MSSEGLGFLNSDAAFNNQVDICFADGVKVYLAARPLGMTSLICPTDGETIS